MAKRNAVKKTQCTDLLATHRKINDLASECSLKDVDDLILLSGGLANVLNAASELDLKGTDWTTFTLGASCVLDHAARRAEGSLQEIQERITTVRALTSAR